MSGKKGCIVRNQRNKNQPLFLTFILRTFDKNFAQLQNGTGKPFNEKTAIEESMTVYAKWTANVR